MPKPSKRGHEKKSNAFHRKYSIIVQILLMGHGRVNACPLSSNMTCDTKHKTLLIKLADFVPCDFHLPHLVPARTGQAA